MGDIAIHLLTKILREDTAVEGATLCCRPLSHMKCCTLIDGKGLWNHEQDRVAERQAIHHGAFESTLKNHATLNTKLKMWKVGKNV